MLLVKIESNCDLFQKYYSAELLLEKNFAQTSENCFETSQK